MGRASLAATTIAMAGAAAVALWWLTNERPLAPDDVARLGEASAPPELRTIPPTAPVTPRAEVRTDGAEPGNAIVITVVNEDDGRAVANAEVCYHSTRISMRADTEEGRFALEHPGDDDEICLRFGRRAHTDDDGVVRLPWLDAGMLVACSHDGRSGALRLSQKTRPESGWRLVLARHSTLRVEVVDARGQPAAGVPIVVTSLLAEANHRPQPLFTGTTSQPDGVFVVQRPQLRLRDRAKVVRVIADLPGVDTAAEVVLGGTPQRVRLQLPPIANLAFELRDGRGAPLFDRARVRLVPADVSASNLWPEREWDAAIGTGSPPALYSVAAHREYAARTYVQRQTLEARVGPFVAGADGVVTLSFDPGSTSVFGRALDETREPLRGVPVLLRYTAGHRDGSITSQTDDDGRFRFVLQPVDAAALESAQLELNRSPELIGALVLAGPLPVAAVHVGDVVLTPAPLVASGRLEIVGGGGLDDRIEIVAVRKKAFVHEGQTLERQRDSPGLKVLRLDATRFEVSGAVGAERHWLVARSNVHLPSQPVELVVGAQDLVLRLEKGSSLDVEVLLDDRLGLPSPSVQLRLRREGSDEGREPTRQRVGRPVYTWQGLASGTYVLDVVATADTTPLATIGDIVVRAGQDNRDPRLHPLDLRGKLRAIVITAVDENGKRIFARRGEVHIAGRPQASVPMTAGEALVVTTAPSIDVVVAVGGFRLVTLNGIANDSAVTLRAGWTIRLRPHPRPAHGDIEFYVGDTRGRYVRRAVLTTSASEVELIVDEVGAHRLVAITRSGVAAPPPILEASPVEIVVRDTDDVQTFDVTLTPKDR